MSSPTAGGVAAASAAGGVAAASAAGGVAAASAAGYVSCAVLIAARNEEKRIAATLGVLRGLGAAGVPGASGAPGAAVAPWAADTLDGLFKIERLIVVDDASSDGTAAAAKASGAEVYRLPRHGGKGAALNFGLDCLLKNSNEENNGKPSLAEPGLAALGALAEPGLAKLSDLVDVVLFLDADLGASAAEASKLVACVASGEADMAIGVLPGQAGSGGFGLVRKLAAEGIAELSQARGAEGSSSGAEADCGFSPQAPISGQRAVRAAALGGLLPLFKGYGVEVGLTVRALRAGLKVVELPVAMEHRYTGRDLSGFAHRARQYWDIRRALAKLRRE